jgi:hypothetical protein
VVNQKQSERSQESRKPYSPPEIVRVNLRPEEAVLAACKSSVVAGPVGSACVSIVAGCQSLSS